MALHTAPILTTVHQQMSQHPILHTAVVVAADSAPGAAVHMVAEEVEAVAAALHTADLAAAVVVLAVAVSLLTTVHQQMSQHPILHTAVVVAADSAPGAAVHMVAEEVEAVAAALHTADLAAAVVVLAVAVSLHLACVPSARPSHSSRGTLTAESVVVARQQQPAGETASHQERSHRLTGLVDLVHKRQGLVGMGLGQAQAQAEAQATHPHVAQPSGRSTGTRAQPSPPAHMRVLPLPVLWTRMRGPPICRRHHTVAQAVVVVHTPARRYSIPTPTLVLLRPPPPPPRTCTRVPRPPAPRTAARLWRARTAVRSAVLLWRRPARTAVPQVPTEQTRTELLVGVRARTHTHHEQPCRYR
jgi:hypothetical protein